MFIGINQVINDINKKYHGLSRKVLQIHPLSLNIVYVWNSTVEASRFLNINQECIVGTCNGKYKHAGGYF